MRAIAESALEQLQGRVIWPAIALHLDYPPAPVRAWSGIGTIQYDGHNWLGVGSLGEIEGFEEVDDIKSTSIKASLINIPDKEFSESASLPLRGHPLSVHLLLFDPDFGTIVSGFRLWRGFVDSVAAFIEPGSSGLAITGASDMAVIRKSPGLLYDSESQKALYSDDTSLRFVTVIQNNEIRF